VVLDRPPLPDEPDGKPYGGYAGLSARLAKDWNEVRAWQAAQGGACWLAVDRVPETKTVIVELSLSPEQ
jgi:hypothetical protein